MRTRSLHSLTLGLLLLSVGACGPATPAPLVERAPSPRPTATAVASAPSTSANASASDRPLPASYLALFDDLLAKIDANHTFAEIRKPTWAADKAKLRNEFERVTTREQALVALHHLQMALGDRHCYLQPPTDLRPMRLSLGLTLFAETLGGRTVVRVDELLDPDLVKAGTVHEGDEIVAVDGQPVAAWLAANPFVTSSLNPEVASNERANAIVATRRPWSTTQKGDARTLRLLRGGAERDVTLSFVHPGKWEDVEQPSFDDAPSMAAVGCRFDKRPPYADFELSAVGANLCVYRPKNGKADTRLVRFVSFNYGGDDDGLRTARADHNLLVRELGRAKAVVLDLHENHGGNNPFVFLSWFASKAWDHEQVHVRVSPEFTEDETRQFLFGDAGLVARYREAAGNGTRELSWPFLCNKDGKRVLTGTCDAQGPRTSELVTRAPIAVVTGPECTSSCDGIAAGWSTFEMGPIVGKQPAHGFTTVRHAYPLIGPDGRDLGTFRIALSWEGYPRTGKPLEGAPIRLDWEAPSTFETRRTWVDLAVKEARRRAEGARATPGPAIASSKD